MDLAMLDKFNKYWEEKNNVMILATILDPRFKMRFISWCFNQMYEPSKASKELDDVKSSWNIFIYNMRWIIGIIRLLIEVL